MNIVFNDAKGNQHLKSNGINFFLGANQSGKTYILDILKQGFQGQYKNFTVDGVPVDKTKYNVIFFDDITDFSNEFKFTKNNIFRKTIYDNIIKELDENNILGKVNKIFDKIDDKVNEYLDLKVNNNSENNIKFDIEIENINDIVDKFTNIYIDNYLLNKDNLPRSTKRKLIYELLLLELDEEVSNIVIIDNFDLYLDYQNTKKIIKKLEEYSKDKPNTHFFLTTSNNIYEFVEEKNNIYHISKNKIKHIYDVKSIIENAIIKESFIKDKIEYNNIDFNKYKQENFILYINEIEKKYKIIMDKYQTEIGKIYINNSLNTDEIKYEDKFYKFFFEELDKRINVE